MNKHPEGLPFEPTGPGFDRQVTIPWTSSKPLLVSKQNIEATRKNHPDEWEAANDALPEPVASAPKSGILIRRKPTWSDDERARLATLAVLVEHGMFTQDRLVIEGEREPAA